MYRNHDIDVFLTLDVVFTAADGNAIYQWNQLIKSIDQITKVVNNTMSIIDVLFPLFTTANYRFDKVLCVYRFSILLCYLFFLNRVSKRNFFEKLTRRLLSITYFKDCFDVFVLCWNTWRNYRKGLLRLTYKLHSLYALWCKYKCLQIQIYWHWWHQYN